MQKVRTLIKNDFAPVIKGNVTEQEGCSVIDIEMKLRPSTSISIAALMLIAVMTLMYAPRAPIGFYLFLIALYIVPMGFFQYDVAVTTRRLRDVFEAT